MADRKQDFLTASNALNIAKLACLALIFYVFHESINYGFVQWDDDVLILKNETLKHLSLDNLIPSLKTMFSESIAGSYIPLTIASFGIDKLLFGIENPEYWHLHNIVLHLICSTVVYQIGRQIGLRPMLSILLMMVFALHPMKVESVVWISERKDLLYSLYFLSAILVYLKMINGHITNKSKAWLIIYILFACSLLSKIQAVTLPLSLLCFDYLMKNRINFKNILTKTPMLLCSLVFGLISINILAKDNLINTAEYFTTIERMSIASFAWFSYVVKFIIPGDLSPIYLLPAKITLPFVASLITLSFLPFVFYKLHKMAYKHLVFAYMFFTANVFFLLQWVGVGQGFLADRFTYLPYLGLGIGLLFHFQKTIFQSKKLKLVGSFACVLFVVGLSFKSIEQISVWKDTGSLFTRVLETQGPSVKAYWLRANHYRDIGSFSQAKNDYDKAIELNPQKHEVLNARGKLFFMMAKSDQNYLHLALEDFDEALKHSPNKIEYLSNRGASYVSLKQEVKALSDFNKAIQIDSEYANAYLNRSVIYNRQNLLSEALFDLKQYLKLKPNNDKLWFEAGKLENKLGLFGDATTSFTYALSLNDQESKYYQARALAFKNAGNIPAARADMISFNNIEELNSTENAQLSIR